MECRTDEGDSPLHYAAYSGCFESSLFLLKLKPELINRQNASGDTALHIAARESHMELLQLLIQRQANEQCMNNESKIPLDLIRTDLRGAVLNSINVRKENSLVEAKEAKQVKR